MNLFYIRYFVELAKEQQYTKAAKNLNTAEFKPCDSPVRRRTWGIII